MLFIGSDDGVYRTRIDEPSESTRVLSAGRVMRLRQFGDAGLFAATQTGLYRSMNGTEWTNLDVPRDQTYAVCVSADGTQLYAGTSPAHVYTAPIGALDGTSIPWTELWGFQTLPSREEWRLPRHNDRAHVRDLHTDPAHSNRIVAGVEVGGVHVADVHDAEALVSQPEHRRSGDDGGVTWTQRSNGVDDDVHELRVVGPAEYFAATGHGLFRTRDAGQTWKRLDQSVPQSYFRCVFALGDTVYAAGALSNSSTWNDPDADPALFSCSQSGSLDTIPIPPVDEMVTGMTAVDDDLLIATHRGHLFVHRGSWHNLGEFPVRGPLTGRYTPICSYERLQ
ncbi:WD40/YVTN/BNR-like repeat-containing protein [Halocatena pleomorpha]|uniref:Glycosyl hydrolase n=1 Tax=Halocatena pleomorpha TaxID=1785090 RepID=A0A3P3R6Y5_9EURY|nr:glycosyl hydrolase [Halocatena pleomorpha]RRJ29232.1 glycosyl hydrolase [Halocatena pleomorpha]